MEDRGGAACVARVCLDNNIVVVVCASKVNLAVSDATFKVASRLMSEAALVLG